MKLFAAALLLATSVALPADAACRIAGAKCLTPEKKSAAPRYAEGEILPRGKYQVVLNTEYFGLPQTDGTFWYFKVENRVLKVRPDTMEVLADVTWEARRATW